MRKKSTSFVIKQTVTVILNKLEMVMYLPPRYTTHKAFENLAVSNKQLVRKGNKIPMLYTQNRGTGQMR